MTTQLRYLVSTRLNALDQGVGFERGANEHDLDDAIAAMQARRKGREIVVLIDHGADGNGREVFVVDADGTRTRL
jgi:hypothetical protein